jgi:ribokinase
VFLRAAGGKASIRLSPPLGSVPERSVTSVGNDVEADDVLMTLERDGIATDHVVRAAGMPTACTLICVDVHGRKQTASRPGANLALNERHIAEDLLARAAVLRTQLEIPIETVVHAARLAKRASLIVVLDAAPAAEISQELIALADVVTNSEEAHVLSRVDVGDQTSAIAAARAIRLRGARPVTWEQRTDVRSSARPVSTGCPAIASP